MVAYLPFTDDFTDWCGNTWTAGGNPSIKDEKLYLPGESYLTCPDLTAKIGQTWSIQCRIKVMNTGGDRYAFHTFNANYGTSGYGSNYWLGLAASNGRLIQFGNDSYFGGIVANQEQLLELTYDGSDLRVYVDEVLKLTKTFAVTLGGTFTIGGNSGRFEQTGYFAGDCFIGYISEFKVYSGLILH